MARAAIRGRLSWTLAEVVDLVDETSRVRSIVLDVPEWPGHRAGQHVDVRLTAEDGYQAQRSYSIASPPEDQRLALTVEGLPDGEVSSYLVGELRVGDMIELRGPVGGYFVWEADMGGPLLLVAGGSGIVPLMSMLRHRDASGAEVGAKLLYSSRSWEDVIYRDELERLGVRHPRAGDRPHADPIPALGMDRLRAPGGRPDARRDRVACLQHAVGVRVRTDALRRGGCRRPRASRIPHHQREDGAVRTNGRLDGERRDAGRR